MGCRTRDYARYLQEDLLCDKFFVELNSMDFVIIFLPGFDDHGRKYDPNGNLLNWWSEETHIAFKSKAQCFIDQVKYCYSCINLLFVGCY